jgi:P2 family phage contractile tail tube protein
MGVPRKLKDFNVFSDGVSYEGEIPEVTLPKLSRKMEEYRAGGMSGPISVDYGSEALTLEFSTGGLLKDALKKYAAKKHNAVQLRFSGAYQEDAEGGVDAVDVVVRGRYKEIDMGTAKSAEDGGHKFSMALSYYKLTINNEVIYEFDFINGVEIIGGVDQRADIRKAIGL